MNYKNLLTPLDSQGTCLVPFAIREDVKDYLSEKGYKFTVSNDSWTNPYEFAAIRRIGFHVLEIKNYRGDIVKELLQNCRFNQ
jgi:hypothetical protein